ncbi:glucokinase [Methylocapsa palsarum]|uniref:Glucokinase n=1 Tax=Methylocapsa palsarum TaxID=1612308 RepID=A0A1I3ZN09_9HYPH|nr:glucokinase [Methylocapsa palsarum]SFK45524.1 glucokinase [Methylocapsa palsarum]
MKFPFPVLVCDIGGTNARFALAAGPGAPLEPGPHVRTADFPSFEDAVAAAVPRLSARPLSLIACAAGPVAGRTVKLTNANWLIDGETVAARAALRQGLLLNDFEAQALSLPVLRREATIPIGRDFKPRPGVQLVIGLGTGLGAAALIEADGRHLVLPTEAGHMDFGPKGTKQAAIWSRLDTRPHGRISVETLLSGSGLARLHRARRLEEGQAEPSLDEIALVARANADPGGDEAATLRLAWSLVARFSGDFALAFLAKGGVTYAGGILPRLVKFLNAQDFRAEFENKAPLEDVLRSIATRLIVAKDSVLSGMAAIAAAPQNYAIDYARRAWR